MQFWVWLYWSTSSFTLNFYNMHSPIGQLEFFVFLSWIFFKRSTYSSHPSRNLQGRRLVHCTFAFYKPNTYTVCNVSNYTLKFLVIYLIYDKGIINGYPKNGYTRPLIIENHTIRLRNWKFIYCYNPKYHIALSKMAMKKITYRWL